MPSTISTATLTTLRDNLLTAYTKLSTEGVTSYSIGDQQFTLADIDKIWKQIERLDSLIARRSTGKGGARGRNRISFGNVDL